MRSAGILMPVFSLPSNYGIGTFGKEAYRFVDFLKKAGQRYWQILPLSPTSYGDSPYQSFSAYAGNPYFIDLDILCDDGYLKKNEYSDIYWGDNNKIDYALLYQKRFAVLRRAYSRFAEKTPSDYKEFIRKNLFWLEDYALFMALKNANDSKSWDNWKNELKYRDKQALKEAKKLYKEDIDFFMMLQYLFEKQWFELKNYANDNGIKIIGDIPIYVAYDSADVWCAPSQFELDENLLPKRVAGCPPDEFSKSGQLWGNPLYNWKEMKNSITPYDWWLRRIKYTLSLYDVVRIDHFRGFESYYAIPFGDKDATGGIWVKGPGIHFFDFVKKKLGELPIIAEDLGFMTEEVKRMLDASGFPGMKVLEFAFDDDSDSEYLPHNFGKNCVVYTGTHDNDTVVGWADVLSDRDLKFANNYMRVTGEDPINWAMIKTAYSTSADTVIIPIQDFCGMGSEARINIPSTVGDNWTWRIDSGCINDWLAQIIKDVATVYRRVNIARQ
ncbi:MAG: 4-alpha-glucanotransferase [Acutalibacteraceae bacterium]|nr:4-alpha-glucanotransferase [Acutalibacteraceae bacterium]